MEENKVILNIKTETITFGTDSLSQRRIDSSSVTRLKTIMATLYNNNANLYFNDLSRFE
jgi:hypothetical protein